MKGVKESNIITYLFGLLCVSFLLFSSINFVSAQSTTAASDFIGFMTEISIFFSEFFLSLGLTVDNLSVALLWVLLWIILYSITVQLFDTRSAYSFGIRAIPGAISAIIAILTFIALPEGFVTALILQYGAVGATILAVLPFLIIFYFSFFMTKSLFFARVVWVFYIFYYFGIFTYKLATLPAGTPWFEYIPYGIAIIVGIIIFLAMKPLRMLIFKGKLEDLEEAGYTTARRAGLLHKLQSEELRESYGGPTRR